MSNETLRKNMLKELTGSYGRGFDKKLLGKIDELPIMFRGSKRKMKPKRGGIVSGGCGDCQNCPCKQMQMDGGAVFPFGGSLPYGNIGLPNPFSELISKMSGSKGGIVSGGEMIGGRKKMAKSKRPMSAYNKFVKEAMKYVIQETSHKPKDAMRVIGIAWRDSGRKHAAALDALKRMLSVKRSKKVGGLILGGSVCPYDEKTCNELKKYKNEFLDCFDDQGYSTEEGEIIASVENDILEDLRPMARKKALKKIFPSGNCKDIPNDIYEQLGQTYGDEKKMRSRKRAKGGLVVRG